MVDGAFVFYVGAGHVARLLHALFSLKNSVFIIFENDAKTMKIS